MKKGSRLKNCFRCNNKDLCSRLNDGAHKLNNATTNQPTTHLNKSPCHHPRTQQYWSQEDAVISERTRLSVCSNKITMWSLWTIWSIPMPFRWKRWPRLSVSRKKKRKRVLYFTRWTSVMKRHCVKCLKCRRNSFPAFTLLVSR